MTALKTIPGSRGAADAFALGMTSGGRGLA
jgi:hypothetical protein